ncbi:hypothetical protein EDC96DRAFT_507693 [Choanephora cucurbitarum]|nr:hypothetical protein EDC96DRAFT_507693 [Choanephora cucurbitarum]
MNMSLSVTAYLQGVLLSLCLSSYSFFFSCHNHHDGNYVSTIQVAIIILYYSYMQKHSQSL